MYELICFTKNKTCQDVLHLHAKLVSLHSLSHLTNLLSAAFVSLVLSLPSAVLPASDALPLLLPSPLSVWSPQPLLAAAVAPLLLFVLLREGEKERRREGGREGGKERGREGGTKEER